MDFYFGPYSGNSARSLFALLESGAPFEPHKLDILTGQNRKSDYTAINPMGKIPSLVDGDVQLWESNAINWYVAERFPQAGLLPGSLADRARVQRWLFFQAAHVTPAAMPVYRHGHKGLQAVFKVSASAAEAEAGRKELARYLAVLDEALQGQDWLEGAFTLADVAYAPHFKLMAEAGFDFGAWPSVRGWVQRLWNRPAWMKTAEMVGSPPWP